MSSTLRFDAITDPVRLAAVKQTGLVDSAPEAAFDDLTRMAALVLEAPFAFATVVDDRHSFWKSRYGIEPDGPTRNGVEDSFCQYVVRSEREFVVGDAEADDRTKTNPSIAAMGVRAWLGFPLHAPGGAVIGSFCVVDTVPRRWTPRDVEVMRTCAAAASREIRLRDLVRREHDARDRAEAFARTLQQTLLPPVSPEIPGLDVGARFQSAGLGADLVGDFYDVFPSHDGTWNLVVGDICGKGIEAAKVAAFVRPILGAISMRTLGPAQTLARLNEILLDRSPVPDRFLSAILAKLTLDGDVCHVRLARAGHPPPIVRRADGTLEKIEPFGQLLGLFPSPHVEETHFDLGPGDLLMAYTDGVDEARAGSGEPVFGYDALAERLRVAGEDADAPAIALAIEETVLAFAGGVAKDDIAIVIVKVPSA